MPLTTWGESDVAIIAKTTRVRGFTKDRGSTKALDISFWQEGQCDYHDGSVGKRKLGRLGPRDSGELSNMAKNIVIGCDGTGNEFGESKSNVVKLYKMLVHDASQVTCYHPGVGTIGARNALTGLGKWWTKVIGLAFGYGISDNIADAYQFLMRTFQPDDTLYVFGFSRGAYTARALCGMLHIIGLLREDNEGLIPYSIRMLKEKNIDFAVAADFKKTFCRECKPHFVGVWDAVSSVGWVYNVAHFPGTKATHNPDMRVIRHAVSIDERRAFFRQNLFGAPHDAQQDIKEVWFAGVHSDVGGSYPESESQLSKIALRWMVCEAELAVFG
jgi:uncharacterized protein (DUF2235 family)